MVPPMITTRTASRYPQEGDDGPVSPHPGPSDGKLPDVQQPFDVVMQGTVFLDVVFTGLPALPTLGTEIHSEGMGSCPGGIANLAVAAMLHDGADAISGALLFYGVYDADFDNESYRFFAEGPGLTRGKMQRYWDWYVADAALRDDPLIAPLKAHDQALKALPPLHLVAAGIDPLLSDSIAFANRLAELGRVERLHIVSGVVHGFLQMSLLLPEARAVLADAGAFIRAHA